MKNRIPKSKNNISITQDIIVTVVAKRKIAQKLAALSKFNLKLLSDTLTDALLWISDRKKRRPKPKNNSKNMYPRN